MKKFVQIISIPLTLLIIYLSMYVVWNIFGLPSDDSLLVIVKEWFTSYGLWVVFISALIEGFLLLGQYFPGGFIIFLGVISAGKDIPRATEVVLVVSIAFFIAYSLNYIVGKYGWYKFLVKFGLGKQIEESKDKLLKQGLNVIFFSYWEPNLASLTATAAGILDFPFKKFSVYSALGVLLWNIFWGTLVYNLGESALHIAGITWILIIFSVWIVVILVKSFVFKGKGAMSEIVIVGAGASGLMSALELAKAGRKIVVLEARDRIGGRILPLDNDFGYPAEGGAEWIHGEAPITRALIKEAGLTIINEDGEIWNARGSELQPHKSFIKSNDLLKEKLNNLKNDISIADFLDQNFGSESDSDFRNSITKMVEGYDAADPKLMSTFALREEWLGKTSMAMIADDSRIKEGYGALINFLKEECIKRGVKIHLNIQVKKIEKNADLVTITSKDGTAFKANKVVVTVPLPVLRDIEFNQELKDKIDLVSRIGFGNVIKVLIKFKTRWWEKNQGKDLSKMAFILSNEKFLTLWTQYPEINTVLTAWMAGPEALKYKEYADEEILSLALKSISNVLKVDEDFLKKEVVYSRVINWVKDPFTKGSYSYITFKTEDACEKLSEPFDNCIFFAGEALYSGPENATVEGALGSGKELAGRILK